MLAALLFLPALLLLPGAESEADPSLAAQAARLGTLLRDVAEDELGLELLRDLSRQRQQQRKTKKQEAAQVVAAKLQAKLEAYTGLAMRNGRAMEEILAAAGQSAPGSASNVSSCCEVRPGLMRMEANFGTLVNEAFACQLSSPAAADVLDEGVARNLSQLMLATRAAQPRVKWQYFMSAGAGAGGAHLEYPATRASGCSSGRSDARHRAVYFSTLHRRTKHVVILFDRGSAMSPRQMDAGRAIVQYVTSTLTDSDYVGFVAAADTVYHPLSPDCRLQTLVRASLGAKIELSKFINVVQASRSPTDQAKAFQAVQDLIRNSKLEEGATVHVLYISRGHLAQLAEKEGVFQALAALRRSVAQQVVINSYATTDGTKSQSTTFELQYLEQVAAQNFAVHNLTVEGPAATVAGQFAQIGPDDDVAKEIGDWVRGDAGGDHREAEQVAVLPPAWDPVGHGAVFSFGVALRVADAVVGVGGLDVHFNDLMEDVLSFPSTEETFVCLLRRHGGSLRVVFHPDVYDREDSTLAFVELGEAEKLDRSADLQDSILSQPSGSLIVARWSKTTDAFSDRYSATWRWVKSDFIVLVLARVQQQVSSLPPSPSDKGSQQLEMPPIYYQRRQEGGATGGSSSVNSATKEKLCRHFRSLATLQSGSLYLSPSAFSSSFARANERFSDSMHSYMAYLTDQTRLIANPGLREGLREDVGLLSQLIFAWRNRTSHSRRQPFFVDRYAGMTSGVYVSYPGVSLPVLFEFTAQKWFTTALRFPGRVVATGPRLQKHGAGYVVVLSQSLSDAAAAAQLLLPLPSATAAAAAAGIDVPLSYFEKLVTDASPECLHPDVTCFVLDQDGTLVYHPVMTEPTYFGPVIDQHLNHKEPNVGKDLMSFSSAVRKTTCKSFADETTRRYYEFNTDLSEVVSSTIQGPGCNSAYRLAAVPGTNLLLGVINATCQAAAVFCPCNINSRKCLICPFSEEETKKSCECPCECPLRDELCAATRQEDASLLPACKRRPAEEILLLVQDDEGAGGGGEAVDPLGDVPQCFPITCSALTTKGECSVMPGCAWCQVELEQDPELESPSFSPLTHPYCAEQERCFRGALGSPNPYEARGKMLRERSEAAAGSASRSPVGPIIGGVLVFFLFLAFSVFCYKQRFGFGPGGGEGDERCAGRIMFRGGTNSALGGNIEVEEDDEVREMHGHHNVIALDNVAAAAMSPYRMNPGYRRPPPGTDSDHGYSTMTPLGGDVDSEILPYTASGPARDRLRHRPPASLHSVTSGVSSRTSSPAPSLVQQQQHLRLRQEMAVAEEKRLLSETPSSSSSSSEVTQQQQTVLSPNQFVVSATVHMVDTQ